MRTPFARRPAYLSAHALACFAATFLVYALTSSPRVGLEDDGIFLMTASYNGVAHPPGYPLFTLLGWLASQIPVSTIAWRIHMTSALAGALACVVVWRIALHYTGRLPAAYLAGIGYGLSATFWSQAIVAEVYTLNSLLCFSVYYLLLRAAHRSAPSLPAPTALAGGLLAGLGLSLHWPLFVLTSLALLPFLWQLGKSLLRQSPIILAGLLAGLLPFAWMVFRSHASDIPAFYGPISSWNEFIFYVLRKGYSAIDTSPTAGLQDQLKFILSALRSTVTEFSVVAAPFILFGSVRLLRVGYRSAALSTVLGFAATTVLLPLLLHFDYDFFHQALFRVYLLTAYGFAAIWLAVGAASSVEYLEKRFAGRLQQAQPAWLIPLGLLTTILVSNLPLNNRADDRVADTYARVALNALPENAALWLESDLTTGPFGYLNLVEAVRPDVTLYNAAGFVFPNRLYRPFRQDKDQEKAIVARFIRETDRPLAYIDPLEHPYGARNHGLFYVVDRKLAAGETAVVMKPGIARYFRDMLNSPEPRDPWQMLHREYLVAAYGTWLAQFISATPEAKQHDWVLSELDLISTHLYGALAIARALIAASNPDWERADAALGRAGSLLDTAFFKRTPADFYYLKGLAAERRGNAREGADWFCQSWQAWPLPENESYGRRKEDCRP